MLYPELKECLQFVAQVSAGAELSRQGKAFILHQGMIDQAMQGTIFTGKISIKGLSGNLQLIAKLTDRNFLEMPRQHDLQQAFFQLPLSVGRLFRLAQFVHSSPPHFDFLAIL
jgi:hypothetical protein